jgi:hypothetical protein
MPSADQVSVKSPHLMMMQWHEWVVLIAGSTGSALRAIGPPNSHVTRDTPRDPGYAASATGSLYRSDLTIIAQTVRASLLAWAIAATLSAAWPAMLQAKAGASCRGSSHSK